MDKRFFVFSKNGNMPHFSSGFGLSFAIEVNEYITPLQGFGQSLVISVALLPGFSEKVNQGCRQYSRRITEGITEYDPP